MRRVLHLFALFAVANLAACGGASSSPAANAPDPPKTKAESERPATPPSDANAMADAGAATAPPAGTSEEKNSGAKDGGNNAFALKVLQRAKKNENVMLSGVSIRQALGALYFGAKGETASEMARALSLPESATAAKAEEAALLEAARGQSTELAIANQIWTDKKLPLDAKYTTLVQDTYKAGPSSVDFTKPEDARKTINAWVSQKTQSKIPELLPSGSVDTHTRLVVTNAIWFKARWSTPFSKSATKDEAFKTGGKSVNVPTMHNTDTFRFAQTDGVKILDLGYDGADMSMMLVLPDDANALGKLEDKLTAEDIDKWSLALASGRVNVSLPRFTFRSGGLMKPALEELGMKTAFTPKADFQSMFASKPTEPIYVGQVFHQTWVAVDELGTEAAAATGGVMRTTSLPMGPIAEFKADHPFLFFIRGKGRILFAGRVVDPKKS